MLNLILISNHVFRPTALPRVNVPVRLRMSFCADPISTLVLLMGPSTTVGSTILTTGLCQMDPQHSSSTTALSLTTVDASELSTKIGVKVSASVHLTKLFPAHQFFVTQILTSAPSSFNIRLVVRTFKMWVKFILVNLSGITILKIGRIMYSFLSTERCCAKNSHE